MRNDYHFSDLVYQKTDYEEATATLSRLTQGVKEAKSADELFDLLKQHEDFAEQIGYMATLAYIHMSLDSSDQGFAEAAAYEMAGASQLPESVFARAVLDSPYFPEVTKKYGEEYRLRLEKSFRLQKEGLDLIGKEAQLTNEYQRLKAMIRIPFRGEEYSEGQLLPLRESTDRDTRRDATKALLTAYRDKKEEFTALLKELMTVRDGIAKANGFSDYGAYKNVSYDRNDYGDEEIERFCAQVKEHLVPLISGLHEAQRKRLGVDRLYRYDMILNFADGNAQPVGDVDSLTKASVEMYDRLNPALGDFFRGMIKTGSFEVAPSDKKVSGMGFQTDLKRDLYPFVFNNCNGTDSDVTVFTHEIGHAWQGYLTVEAHMPALYDRMVHDAMEIPSKTMELFTFSGAEGFFGKDADKFRYAHFCTMLEEIAHFCMSHELESFVLTHPDASFEEIAEQKRVLEQVYFPGLHGGDLEPFYEEGIDMLRDMVLFMFPRYVMSY
ncbi:MAG: hypothetical protein IJP92_07315, partial [Lachnospiraceae bacterium]|nr:hypothetical protein [Lachnospiraceae bacterium]